MAYAKKKTKPSGTRQQVPVANLVTDEQHTTLVKWVNEADDATRESRDSSEKCRDYYDSKQWTPAEIAKLKKQKQAATVINRIKPKMDGLMGMERANRTTAKAQPRTPKETGAALAATEATRYVLQDNAYEQKRSTTWDHLLVEGTGGIEVIVKPVEGKDNDYDVVVNAIPWDRIIYDAHSRSKSFSDNPRHQGQVVWMDYDEAAALYPAGKDILESMQSGSSTYDDRPRWMDAGRRRCKIVELYYRKDGDWWYACFTRGGFLKGPQKSPYVDPETKETECPYEFASLFVDRDGNRYGAALQYLDVQDEINKRRSKALHLMSVRQIAVFKGAVDDVNKLRQELAKPDGVVELNQPMNESFEVLKTNDMAAAQFNLLTEAKQEIDAVGYNAAASGKDQRAISGVALRQRTQASQTELAPMFDVLKNLDIRVYRKVWNRIRQYWKAEKWIRVTDDENNLKFVGLNKPMTNADMILKEAEDQKAPPEQLAQLKAQLEVAAQTDPTLNQVVDTHNDIASMDVDIIMDDAPDTVTQEVEDFQAMAEMVKSGFPIPPKAVIMASPLSNKDKILKMMDEQPQIPPELQKKMEQMQEGLQKAGEQVQQLTQENQAMKADTQGEQAKLLLSAQESKAKLDARREEQMAELAVKREVQAEELALERERAAATIQLEREKAEAQIALQGMKQAGDHKAQADKLVFDQQCRSEDQQAKTREKAESDAASVMPKLEQAFTSMQATLEKMAQLQAELLAAFKAPKNIDLSNVVFQRDALGNLTGAAATATPTLQ